MSAVNEQCIDVDCCIELFVTRGPVLTKHHVLEYVARWNWHRPAESSNVMVKQTSAHDTIWHTITTTNCTTCDFCFTSHFSEATLVTLVSKKSEPSKSVAPDFYMLVNKKIKSLYSQNCYENKSLPIQLKVS